MNIYDFSMFKRAILRNDISAVKFLESRLSNIKISEYKKLISFTRGNAINNILLCKILKTAQEKNISFKKLIK